MDVEIKGSCLPLFTTPEYEDTYGRVPGHLAAKERINSGVYLPLSSVSTVIGDVFSLSAKLAFAVTLMLYGVNGFRSPITQLRSSGPTSRWLGGDDDPLTST